MWERPTATAGVTDPFTGEGQMGINSVSPSERIINLISGGSSPSLNGTHSDTKDSHCMCLPWVSFRPLHTMKPIIPTRGVHRQSSTNAWESAPPLQCGAPSVGSRPAGAAVAAGRRGAAGAGGLERLLAALHVPRAAACLSHHHFEVF